MIRRNAIVLAGVLGLLWVCLVLPNISGAQERVKSLTIRQFEIEEAIRNGLKYYLEPRDYVLRVKLTGEQRVAGVEHEALPGFGPMVNPAQAKGEKYWEILRMQVDLVMHKEVSPSLNTYISEIVPILSGLDYERGDEFNFVPIVPQALEPPPIAQAQAAPATTEAEKPKPEKPAVVVATLPKADEQKGEQPQETPETQPEPVAATEPVVDGPPPGLWEVMTLVEKVLAAGLALLLLLLLFVLWKLNRMQSAEQQGLAKLLAQQQQLALPGMGAMALPSPQQTLESVEESRRKYLQTQESQVQDALLQESNERMAQDIVKQLVGRDDWKQDLIQEMTRDKQSMESLTQLLAVIGPETTRSLFGRVMPQDSFLELEQLARDAKVSTAEANTTLKNVAMFLLTRKLIAPEQPTTNLFGFLEEMSTGQVSYLLNDEPSKIKAIVISRLISEQAAEILHNLSKDERTLVAVELGRLSELPTKLVEQVAYNLADKARTVPDENSVSVDGIRFVADVLGDADPTTREELLNGLRVTDQKLSEEIESRCFIFDSIPFVPREVLVEVVRKLPPDVVVTAISGADKSIQEAVVLCFPEQTRKAIVSALKAKKPSAEEIREARQQFVKSMRSMSDANKVDLREVNSAFSHQESAPALSYEEQPA